MTAQGHFSADPHSRVCLERSDPGWKWLFKYMEFVYFDPGRDGRGCRETYNDHYHCVRQTFTSVLTSQGNISDWIPKYLKQDHAVTPRSKAIRRDCVQEGTWQYVRSSLVARPHSNEATARLRLLGTSTCPAQILVTHSGSCSYVTDVHHFILFTDAKLLNLINFY